VLIFRLDQIFAVYGQGADERSTGEHLGRITISAGVATLRPDDVAQSFIGRADAALYAAKRSGRNRIMCEADPEVAQFDMTEVA
jgi:diguanylate cyclase